MKAQVRIVSTPTEFDFGTYLGTLEFTDAVLTDEKSEASYGQPVVVIGKEAYTRWELETSYLAEGRRVHLEGDEDASELIRCWERRP